MPNEITRRAFGSRFPLFRALPQFVILDHYPVQVLEEDDQKVDRRKRGQEMLSRTRFLDGSHCREPRTRYYYMLVVLLTHHAPLE